MVQASRGIGWSASATAWVALALAASWVGCGDEGAAGSGAGRGADGGRGDLGAARGDGALDGGAGDDGGGDEPDARPGEDVVSPQDTTPRPDAGGRPDLAGLPDTAAVQDLGGEVPTDAAGADVTVDAGPDREERCPPAPGEIAAVEQRSDGRYRIVDRFPGAGLGDRRVVVYLPAGYDDDPQRRYPVLYMHDGQNLFHDHEATYGTAWQVDDVLDALVAAGEVEPTLVVGVDNTAERLQEYRSGADPTLDDGTLAAAYRRFLAERVLPWVNATFRTDCRRSRTTLMGSSMGAVASLAHALRYPALWGRIGCVSSAFWFGDAPAPGELATWLDEHAPARLPDRIWMDVGTAETSAHVADPSTYLEQSRRVRDRLLGLGLPLGAGLAYLEEPGAVHSEAAWQARLPMMLRFLLAEDPTPLLRGQATLRLVPVVSEISLTQPEGIHLVVQRLLPQLSQTLPNAEVAFSADDPALVELTPAGLVLPRAVGSTVLRARWGDLQASAPLVVDEHEQVTLTWTVQVPDGTPAADGVYVGGDLAQLGGWGEGWSVMRQMIPLGGRRWQTRLTLPYGTAVNYKYTRGSWATVEKEVDGAERPNRTATADGAWALDDEVLRWADQ